MVWENIYLRAQRDNFEEALQNAKNFSVGLEIQTFTLPESYHCNVNKRLDKYITALRGFDAPISFHAPFIDINIVSLDETIAAYSHKVFEFAIDAAQRLGADKIIIHTGFNPQIAYEPYLTSFPQVYAEGLEFFADKATRKGIAIHIENIFESTPQNNISIVEAMASSEVKLCLDVGHALLFTEIDLVEWLTLMGERLRYVHLHENDGVYDLHTPALGENADVTALMQTMAKMDLPPAICLEIVDEPDVIEKAIEYVRSFE